MQNIIHTLPEQVANQIAAGEVVQRPSSVVKELLENSIDAGASNIKLIVKDAGKTIIQVIDDGKGMNSADAVKCFERHATSKISSSDDLFALTTKGFRGEALASIASVAQVEMKTRLDNDETGTYIVLEDGKIKLNEPCQLNKGTNFSVKNLFYNIPARRNFLKEDNTELKHIIDEFERVALAHPEIAFSFTSNNNEIFRLSSGNLMQRIIGLFGQNLNQKLVALEETTDYLQIHGFVGKPDAARKKRGQQFFFVNNRFIKSSYLHHAVSSAYENLIGSDEFPAYFIFMELNPRCIDINIHPTKTEIKFEDEKTIYHLLKTAVKRSLGKNNLAPSLDFEIEQNFEFDYSRDKSQIKAPEIKFNSNFNPFKGEVKQNNQNNWQSLYQNFLQTDANDFPSESNAPTLEIEQEWDKGILNSFQFLNRFIVAESSNGLIVIDQNRAHERILYEHYKTAFTHQSNASQQELFPSSLELSVNDAVLLQGLMPELNFLGFQIELLGKNSFVIHGIPAEIAGMNAPEVLEGLIENYKLNNLEAKLDSKENICRSMAKNNCIKSGKKLSEEEINLLLEHLFQCESFSHSPSGKPVFIEIPAGEIEKQFKRNS